MTSVSQSTRPDGLHDDLHVLRVLHQRKRSHSQVKVAVSADTRERLENPKESLRGHVSRGGHERVRSARGGVRDAAYNTFIQTCTVLNDTRASVAQDP